MSSTRARLLASSLFFPLIASIASAQVNVDVPLRNWTVPPYRATSTGAGLSTMTDISPGIGFVAVTPCRIADTRGLGFSGQAGPPVLDTGTRTFQITGTVTGVPAQCGIPSGADAVSFQFTIVTPNTNGNLIAWPAGGPVPTISILNWSAGETALGNGTIVPVSAAGALSVRINAAVGNATGHLVLDVNGYFTDDYPTGTTLEASSATASPAILAENTSSASDAVAIRGVITTTTPGSSGVAALVGQGLATTGATRGVLGQTASTANNAAGVFGVAGSLVSGVDFSAGVRGESAESIGVLGRGNFGVAGVAATPAGYGVYALGNYGGTGGKHFVEPHPEDPSKVIRFVSLEGNESGTYFRGRARFENGLARIAVPQEFRFVTDAEGLTVQITPIGELATVAVVRMDLEQIVVKSSRNVEFSYMVNGVRKTHKHLKPIGPGQEYMPRSPDAEMPLYLTEGQKEMLVSNGTYNADGTVNLETARRLGWDKEWEKRARPAPQPID